LPLPPDPPLKLIFKPEEFNPVIETVPAVFLVKILPSVVAGPCTVEVTITVLVPGYVEDSVVVIDETYELDIVVVVAAAVAAAAATEVKDLPLRI
jgi:hypothetical protein